MKFKFAILLILTTCINSVYCQNKFDIPQFFNETIGFITSPTNWESGDWIKFISVTGGTLILMTADEPIRNEIIEDSKYNKSVPIVVGKLWGDLSTPIVIFGGLSLYSLIDNNIKTWKVAYEIGQAMLYAGAITNILKVGLGRSRPYNHKGAWTYKPFTFFYDAYHSISGGHSTVAFALSAVLARNVEPIWLKTLIYIPACLTFVSRIYQDQHWVSDCFLGAAIGYFTADWICDKHEKFNSSSKDTGNLNIQPCFSPYSYGLSMNLRF
jgi:hypothetical protein